MQNPTREEMIRMAHETRRQVTNAEVPDELMQQFPVTIEEKAIPFEEGDIRVFYSYPDEMKNPDVLILNMHGGGFIRGRTPNDELFCRRMNHALSCRILDLDYKIAPDYPFPAAVHEAYRTLRWVYENASALEIDPKRIVLMGHSAGGNLCVGAVMRSLEQGTEIPELLVCEYPISPDALEEPEGFGITWRLAKRAARDFLRVSIMQSAIVTVTAKHETDYDLVIRVFGKY